MKAAVLIPFVAVVVCLVLAVSECEAAAPNIQYSFDNIYGVTIANEGTAGPGARIYKSASAELTGNPWRPRGGYLKGALLITPGQTLQMTSATNMDIHDQMSFRMGIWAKFVQVGRAQTIIGRCSGTDRAFLLSVTSDNKPMAVVGGSQVIATTYTSPITNWHHYSVVSWGKGRGYVIIVDGKEVAHGMPGFIRLSTAPPAFGLTVFGRKPSGDPDFTQSSSQMTGYVDHFTYFEDPVPTVCVPLDTVSSGYVPTGECSSSRSASIALIRGFKPSEGATNVGEIMIMASNLVGVSYQWTVGGRIIRDYDDSVETGFQMIPMQPDDYLQQFISFLWLPDANQIHPQSATVQHTVSLVVTGRDGTQCTSSLVFTVTRNTVNDYRQITRIFLFNHLIESESRILKAHRDMHSTNDFATPTYDPGMFLSYHKKLLGRYRAFRNITGYNPLIAWDPSTPYPAGIGAEFVHDRAPAPLIPIPTYFTAAGGSSGRRPSGIPCDTQWGERSLADFGGDLNRIACAITTFHNKIHVAVNADMRTTAMAPNDPLFWAYHNWLDTKIGDVVLGSAATDGMRILSDVNCAQTTTYLYPDYSTPVTTPQSSILGVQLSFEDNTTPYLSNTGVVPSDSLSSFSAGVYRSRGGGIGATMSSLGDASGYIRVGSPADAAPVIGSTEFTVTIWAKRKVVGIAQTILSRGRDNSDKQVQMRFAVDGKLDVIIGQTPRSSSTVVAADTNWHFFAITVSDDMSMPSKSYLSHSAVVYVDGSIVIPRFSISRTDSPSSYFNLMMQETSTGSIVYPLAGQIDEFRLYYAPLNDSEVSSLYTVQRASLLPNALPTLGCRVPLDSPTEFKGTSTTPNYCVPKAFSPSTDADRYTIRDGKALIGSGYLALDATLRGGSVPLVVELIPSNLNVNAVAGEATFSFWVYIPSGSQKHGIFAAYDKTATTPDLPYYIEYTTDRLVSVTCGRNTVQYTLPPLYRNNWHMFTLVSFRDPGLKCSLYVDGAVVGPPFAFQLLARSVSAVCVGRCPSPWGNNNPSILTAQIDDINIWAHALSDTAISTMYGSRKIFVSPTPTVTSSITRTPPPTISNTRTPAGTPSNSPTRTLSPSKSLSNSLTATNSGSISRSATPTPSRNLIPSPSPYTSYPSFWSGSMCNILASGCDGGNWNLIADLSIPTNAQFNTFASVSYTYECSRSSSCPSGWTAGSSKRVAYYLQLGSTWVWASMNPFTTTLSQLGVPADWSFQQTITGLHVETNSGNLSPISSGTGNIEFWSNCYAQGADGIFDWSDIITDPDCYGSMQIFNSAHSAVFGYNAWAHPIGDDVGIGSGSTSGFQPDWTFAANTGSYSTRRLLVFVSWK